MPRSLRLYLGDIQTAIEEIIQFTQGKQFEDYQRERLIQAAVEREFTIIGEAMVQMGHHYPSVRQRIEHARNIVDFRNVLVHDYAEVDHRIVWRIVTKLLEPFKAEIDQWIREADEQ